MRNDRFFKLRARRPGESGRWLLEGFGAIDRGGGSPENFGYDTDIAEGDSGEELGEISPPEGESKGETVVVGEDSVEAVVMDETLSRCGEGRRCREVLTGTWVGTWRGWMVSSSLYRGGSSPKTDINEGNESGKDGGEVCTGMV